MKVFEENDNMIGMINDIVTSLNSYGYNLIDGELNPVKREVNVLGKITTETRWGGQYELILNFKDKITQQLEEELNERED